MSAVGSADIGGDCNVLNTWIYNMGGTDFGWTLFLFKKKTIRHSDCLLASDLSISFCLTSLGDLSTPEIPFLCSHICIPCSILSLVFSLWTSRVQSSCLYFSSLAELGLIFVIHAFACGLYLSYLATPYSL